MGKLYEAIVLLRDDAVERGMSDLAIAYGWSAIRIGEAVLKRKMTENEHYRSCLGKSK